MKIAIAGFHLESASFLPYRCSKAIFEENTTRGVSILKTYTKTNTEPGGFIEECEAGGVDIVPLVYSYLGAFVPHLTFLCGAANAGCC